MFGGGCVSSGFLARVRGGFERLSPLQLLEAKRLGCGGQVLGVFLGLVGTMWLGLWLWVPFLFFTLVVSFVEFVSVHKQVLLLRSVSL